MDKIIQHFNNCKRCLTLPLFLLLPYMLFAQNDTTKKLKSVNVSTTQLPQIQTITPSQQITSADFDRYSAFNVADAIRDFSGVVIKDYGGIGGLKTISVRGLGANHTAVLYDGVEISDSENGQVDLGKFNLNNVQSITLYNGQPLNICTPARSFSSASILSIKTIQPNLTAEKPFQISVGFKTGSFGLVNPYLQWQQRLSKNWSFIVNSYLEKANGQYKYRSSGDGTDSLRTRTNADVSTQEVDGALYWTKNDSNKFSLHANFYNSDRGLPGEVILYSAAYSAQRLWNKDFFTQACYDHTWNNGLHILLNTKFSQNYLRYLDPNFLNAEGRLDQQFTQHEVYQSAVLSYHIAKNWEVSYAADFSINNLFVSYNYNNPFANPVRYSLLNVLATNLIIGKLQLQGSLLNTNITETVKIGTASPGLNVYSPTLVASIKPFENPAIQLRGYYKYIFRNPTFDDLYYGGIGNPNLKPEYAKLINLGTTYSKPLTGFLSYITFTADAYYNNVTNKIVFIPKDAYNGSIQNFGKVDIEGLDVGLKTAANLAEGWKALLSINYTYQSALNVTDPTSSIYLNQLPYTPKNVIAGNAGLEYGALGLYYNQLVSSSRYYTNDNLPGDLLPQYAISDASLVYHFLSKKLPAIASVEVNNLFNKNYVVVQSYPMPGRSVRFSIQITI